MKVPRDFDGESFETKMHRWREQAETRTVGWTPAEDEAFDELERRLNTPRAEDYTTRALRLRDEQRAREEGAVERWIEDERDAA